MTNHNQSSVELTEYFHEKPHVARRVIRVAIAQKHHAERSGLETIHFCAKRNGVAPE